MEDQAKAVARIVREDDELQARMEAEAKATAHALIQRYLGPTIQGPGPAARVYPGQVAANLARALDDDDARVTATVAEKAQPGSERKRFNAVLEIRQVRKSGLRNRHEAYALSL